MTRKMRRVTPVHIRRCWNGVLVSGTAISGIKGVNGFTRSRKRTARANQSIALLKADRNIGSSGHHVHPLMFAVNEMKE